MPYGPFTATGLHYLAEYRLTIFAKVDLLQLTVISGVGFRLAGDRIHDHYTKLVLWYGDTEESLKFLRDHNGNMTVKDFQHMIRAAIGMVIPYLSNLDFTNFTPDRSLSCSSEGNLNFYIGYL